MLKNRFRKSKKIKKVFIRLVSKLEPIFNNIILFPGIIDINENSNYIYFSDIYSILSDGKLSEDVFRVDIYTKKVEKLFDSNFIEDEFYYKFINVIDDNKMVILTNKVIYVYFDEKNVGITEEYRIDDNIKLSNCNITYNNGKFYVVSDKDNDFHSFILDHKGRYIKDIKEFKKGSLFCEFDSNGNIFLTTESSEIIKFDKNFNILKIRKIEDFKLSYDDAVAGRIRISKSGNVFINDKNRILMFDNNLKFIGEINWKFENIEDFFVKNELLYVTDFVEDKSKIIIKIFEKNRLEIMRD